MNSPMRRDVADEINPAVPHLRIRIQPFHHHLGNDAAFVLLQRVNLKLDVGGEGFNLGALGVKEIYNSILLLMRRLHYHKM